MSFQGSSTQCILFSAALSQGNSQRDCCAMLETTSQESVGIERGISALPAAGGRGWHGRYLNTIELCVAF